MYLNSSYPYLFPNTSKRVLHVFPCKIPMVLTGEFVHQSRGFFPGGDHFLYSFELNVLLSRDIVRKILMLVTLGLRDFYG